MGDAGLICSVPVVSLGDSAECTFTMNCTNGTASLTVDGQGSGAVTVVRCSVNGNETNTFTELAQSPDAYDCANPAGFAALAAKCTP